MGIEKPRVSIWIRD